MVSMAFQTLQTKRKPIDFNQFAVEVSGRRAGYEATYGPIDMPRNAGNNRTESKEALLTTLEALGARW
jgi:hypothetical protein